MGIKHHFQSNKADSADTGIVRPTNWNEEHDYTDINPAKITQDATHRFVFDGYNDLALPLHPKETGAGKPTLRDFSGLLRAYTMAVNDISDIDPVELLHGWIEGTLIEIHVHWATRGVDIADRYVNWQVDYSWSNTLTKGGTTAFGAATSLPKEVAIAANTPDKTHIYTSMGTFTPSGGKIGAYLMFGVKRVAAVGGAAPTSDPWILAVGVHYQVTNIGSAAQT